MTIRIGINGFGRIGRTIVRAALTSAYKDVEIVHINDLTDAKTLAHLLKYDSVHGVWEHNAKADGDGIRINDKLVSVSAIKAPEELPWAAKNIDLVLECTGAFKDREGVARHLKGGAKKVLISAPSKNEDLTVVLGVNDDKLDKSKHIVVSNGSCTTNCLAPVAKVLHQALGIKKGLMTTVHSYTNDQRILDLPHSDLRRARAAAQSMIPTSTGAAKAIGLVLPELKGKLDGISIRVPTPNVSLVDATFVTDKSTTKEEVNKLLTQAANGPLKNILAVSEEPLVSIDYNGSTYSSIVDAENTSVMDGNLVKVLAWYDNETGFSYRMLDIARKMV
jgi:glyceraldehyde 3-phosphate dehydrogenase